MSFNPDLPFQTRDGRKARIICMDRKGGSFPIMVLSENAEGELEQLSHHGLDGMLGSGRKESNCDLINIPETHWVNVYAVEFGYSLKIFTSREDADKCASLTMSGDRVACIEFTEGQGL